ncbi:MAG: TetR/AcrR family transcriptional regulator [Aliishimia sp.]
MARTAGSHSDITGPRIEAAAARLIAQHGYAAVSMRQIAAEVGVQAGALYNYIPDKQSLLARLMVRHMEELLAAYDEPDGLNPLGQLEYFVKFHIDQNRERSDQVFIAYMELRNLTPENFAHVEQFRRQYEAKLERILTDGVTEQMFNIPDVKITTRALIAMLNGVNTWFQDAGPLSLHQVRALHWDIAYRAVIKT